MRLAHQRTPGSKDRGTALVFALLVVAFVAAFTLGMMQVNGSVTRRQAASVYDKQAFYLAEAGLSEAYFGLQTGKSGQIGSLEAPALVGDGLAWVDANWGDEGIVTLRSTGLSGTGRSTLELVVRRETNPFGIFADDGIDLEVPFLLDGYDSETTSYEEQAGMNKLAIEPGNEFVFHLLESGGLRLFFNGVYYLCTQYDLATTEFYYSRAWNDYDDMVADTGIDGSTGTFGAGVAGVGVEDGAAGALSFNYEEVTTGGGGQLGTNGSIVLSSTTGEPVQVYGELVPGPEGTLSASANVNISGSSSSRPAPLELSSVHAPDVELLPAFTHTSLIPRVLPPGDVGYEAITVGADSELIIQGPSNIVVGELVLDELATMRIQNGAGAVNLYVTDVADLSEGAFVEVESRETSDFALQGAESASALLLDAKSQMYGMVYAPDSHVQIGADFEVFGMLACNTLDLAPYARLHFDSGVLGDSGVVPIPRMVGWSIQEVPAEVRQNRDDPFVLLGLDPADLSTVYESQENVSWIIEAIGHDAAHDDVEYSGPFELFETSDIDHFTGGNPPTLIAPDATLSRPWRIRISFDPNGPGNNEVFTGTMDEFAASVMRRVKAIHDMVLTPPPEFQ